MGYWGSALAPSRKTRAVGGSGGGSGGGNGSGNGSSVGGSSGGSGSIAVAGGVGGGLHSPSKQRGQSASIRGLLERSGGGSGGGVAGVLTALLRSQRFWLIAMFITLTSRIFVSVTHQGGGLTGGHYGGHPAPVARDVVGWQQLDPGYPVVCTVDPALGFSS